LPLSAWPSRRSLTSLLFFLRRSRSSLSSSSICSDIRFASASRKSLCCRSASVSEGDGRSASVRGSSWLYRLGVLIDEGRDQGLMIDFSTVLSEQWLLTCTDHNGLLTPPTSSAFSPIPVSHTTYLAWRYQGQLLPAALPFRSQNQVEVFCEAVPKASEVSLNRPARAQLHVHQNFLALCASKYYDDCIFRQCPSS
jgi:hypothetical protein